MDSNNLLNHNSMRYLDSAQKNATLAQNQHDIAMSRLFNESKRMKQITVEIRKDYSDYWAHRTPVIEQILSSHQLAQIKKESEKYEQELDEIIGDDEEEFWIQHQGDNQSWSGGSCNNLIEQ